MTENTKKFLWVPSLYFVQGLPFFVVTIFAEVLYKSFGVANEKITLLVSILSLPWILKPLWAPLIEVFSTKRWWLLIAHLTSAFFCLLAALFLFQSQFLLISFVLLFALTFSSATYDIACDGFYLINLNKEEQAYYVGWRTLFYRTAGFFIDGFLMMLIGFVTNHFGKRTGWQVGFAILAVVFLLLFLYHIFILPRQEKELASKELDNGKSNTLETFFGVFKQFVAMPHFVIMLVFLLIYNGVEVQLGRILPLFLLDHKTVGGLALAVQKFGVVFGIFGHSAFLLGALVCGFILSRLHLARSIIVMTLFMVLANLGYLALSWFTPSSFIWIIAAILSGQFAFGLVNSAYMVLLMRIFSSMQYKTAFYAFGTAIMALGIIIFGSVSGYMEKLLGYQDFFLWIVIFGVMILGYTIFTLKRIGFLLSER